MFNLDLSKPIRLYIHNKTIDTVDDLSLWGDPKKDSYIEVEIIKIVSNASNKN